MSWRPLLLWVERALRFRLDVALEFERLLESGGKLEGRAQGNQAESKPEPPRDDDCLRRSPPLRLLYGTYLDRFVVENEREREQECADQD